MEMGLYKKQCCGTVSVRIRKFQGWSDPDLSFPETTILRLEVIFEIPFVIIFEIPYVI
jgi:hypothetical protein